MIRSRENYEMLHLTEYCNCKVMGSDGTIIEMKYEYDDCNREANSLIKDESSTIDSKYVISCQWKYAKRGRKTKWKRTLFE